MGGSGRINEPGKKPDDAQKDEGKAKPTPPPLQADDDDEDGDMATPKRDRYGNDDEPL